MFWSKCVSCSMALAVIQALSVMASNYSCPTLFFYNSTTQRCECDSISASWVHCNQQTMTVQLNSEFCVSYSRQEGSFYIGYSPLKYKFNRTNRMFSELPTDPDLVEDMMCGPYNRKGLLCGQCIEGYGPGVYTLDRRCADCSKFSLASAILLCLLVYTAPITLFFICVVLFRLNITAGPLLGFVLFSQGFSVALEYDPTVYDYIHSHLPFNKHVIEVFLIAFESWNTNFLKSVLPPFCISSKLTGIHVLVLDSLSALYPLILVTVSLVTVELHARNYRVIRVWLALFSFILKKMRITTVTSDAVIRTFSTLMFLSTTKNLFAFYAMIRYINVHKTIDGSVYKTVLYSDPTIEYLSSTHIAFLMVPLVQCLFLVFIPSLILILYPTRIYASLSRCVSNRVHLAITSFVEPINSCLKDGLNGTRDYRALAGIMMFGFTLFYMCISLLDNTIIIVNQFKFNILCCYLSSLLSLFLSYVRPFKSSIANMSFCFYTILFGFGNIVVYLWYDQLSISTFVLELAFGLIGICALVTVAVWALYKLTCCAMHCFV